MNGWITAIARRWWSRTPARRIALIPIFIAAPIVGLLATVNWCSPDSVPAQPIDAFISSLHSLDRDHARKVRVLHFGDSHIASDTESSVVRAYLQNRFGDGGFGLVLPWGGPRFSSGNISYGNSYGWERVHPSYNSPVEDTGLSLNYIETSAPDQSIWLDAAGSEFSVHYLVQPQGGDAEFLLDGVAVGQRRMDANYAQVQVARFTAGDSDARHRFEVRTLGYGRVRILGVSVEKSQPGVVYSAMGLVGARAEYLLKCREETFEDQISAASPDLVILGYGTNETSGSYLNGNAYETALATIISRVRRAAPSALVILLTPPDRGDYRPYQAQHFEQIIQVIIGAQREVAERDGAVVMDLHRAMGGPGSAERWATMQPPLARPDMTHFTNEGYNLLGRYIVGGIMKLYEGGADAESSLPRMGASPRVAELLPPLYSGMMGGATIASNSRWVRYSDPAPTPAEIYYFLRSDGQVVVTNDLTTVDMNHGKLIDSQQAGCLLRRKGSACGSPSPW